MSPTATSTRQRQGPIGPGGELLGGAGRRGEQAEEQQRADGLGRLGRGRADQGEEPDAEQHAPGPGGPRPRPRRGWRTAAAGRSPPRRRRRDGDDRGDDRLAVAESPKIEPNRTLTPAVPSRRALRRRVEGEEQHPEAEDPGEDAADHDVVGLARGPEQSPSRPRRRWWRRTARGAGRARRPGRRGRR